MTTIVYRDGVMAADTRATVNSEAGGSRVFRCDKLYRVTCLDGTEAIVGLAGGSFDGLAFLDWLVSDDKAPPQRLLDGDADFSALMLNRHGLFEYDKWCRPERIRGRFYAIGSGAKAALGALHMGANARQAVAVACKIDPYSARPIISMSLGKGRAQPRGA